MSRTVDQRVVEMQFDNGQFERNVKTSMSTLDKLKQSLNMDGAAKGLENVQQASRNVDFSQMAAGVEALQNRFSTLGIVGMRVIQNLTDSAMQFANRTLSFITSGIVQGGIRRAMNLENAHFQLQGLLKDEKQVSAVMKNVNDSVDGTAYSLDSAAKVASQLAASGMRAGDEMFTSLRAVAGVAAMTNSEYDSIGEIFTTVAGNGRLMGEQLLQLSSRGMNAAATLAEYLHVSEAEVRDMVSKGKIDFQTFAAAMDDAFGEHAKKANETFTGSLSNIKAALARIGALFVSPLIVQNGPIVQFFNTLRERINDIKSAIGPLADQFTGSINKMAESAKAFLSRMSSEDRVQILSNVVKTLTNIFSGLWSILKPVGQAFKDIFPTVAANRLIDFTAKLKDLTAQIKLGSSESKNLRDTFKGIFSVLKLVVNAIIAVAKGASNLLSKLTGVRGGLLGITGAIGRWLMKVASAIDKTGAFQAVVGGLSDYLGRCIESIKKFVVLLKENLVMPGFETLVELLKKLWTLVEKIGGKISDFFKGIGESFNGNSLNGFFTALGTLLLAKHAYKKWFDDWKPMIDRWRTLLEEGFVKGVKTITGGIDTFVSALKAISSNLWAFNKSIKYDNIKKLATALLMLAAALLIISLIDSDKLASSMVVIEVFIANLMAMVKQFDALNGVKGIKGLGVGTSNALGVMGAMLIQLSAAVLILAIALKKLSGLNFGELLIGITGIVALVGTLVGAAKIVSKDEKAVTKFGGQMILMSAGVLILATACKKLAGLSWNELAKGAGGVFTLTATFVAAAKILSKDEKAVSKFAGQMLVMSLGIAIMARVCKSLAGLSWSELAKGALGLVGITAVLVAATKIMSTDSKKALKGAGQMVLLAAAIAIVGKTLSDLSGLSWEGIAKGLIAMSGGITLLAIGLEEMEGTLKGSAALLVAALSLAVLAPVMISLSKMSWEGIAKSLIAIAGAFTIIGLAGLVLEPVIPAILLLSGAIALIGIGCMAAGAGLQLFAAGLAMLVGVVATGATTLVATIKVVLLGILGMVPELAKGLVTAIKSLVDVFIRCVPYIAEGILKLVVGVFEALVKYTPKIVDLAFNFLIKILDGIAKNTPRLIKSIVDMFADIFSGLIDALSNVSPDMLLKGTACLGLLVLIANGLAALVFTAPAALIGTAAFGLVIGELTLVLSALGELVNGRDLSNIVAAGNLLEKIGTTIGKFVGGFVGGVAAGVMSVLPGIGKDLSLFMTNLQPFLDGARSIDASAFDGVMQLIKVMTALSGANLVEYATQFITGSSSIGIFAAQLIPFGEAITQFSETVSGRVDEGAVTAAANAGKILTEMANTIPNTGGFAALFAGDNDLTTFASDIVPFGEAIVKFSETVSGKIDDAAITAAANAGKTLSELQNTLPEIGGLKAVFAGEQSLAMLTNELIPFGEAMVEFSSTVKGIDETAVTGAANAGKTLTAMADTIPTSGGLFSLFVGDNRLDIFGLQLVSFGLAITQFSNIVSGNIDEGAVMAASNAGKIMAEMQATLPNTGGLFSLFTGSSDMGTFGTQLKSFGESIAAFSESISGKIDESAVIAAANAGKAMAEMQATLPNVGGVVQFFTGHKEDLSTFAEGITAFGTAMCGFSQAITSSGTFNPEAVTAAANAGKALAELQNTLPNTGGVVEFFAGHKEDFGTFSEGLVPFGEAMRDFSKTVSGNIDAEAVSAAANAGKVMAEMQATLPTDGGIFSVFSGKSEDMASFGTDLETFGNAIAGFSKILVDGSIDTDKITAAANAGKIIAQMADSIPDSIVNLSILSSKLEPFGESLGKFQSRISEVNVDLLSTAVDKIKEVVEKLASVSTTGLDKFVDSFNKAESKAVSASNKMLDNMISKIEGKKPKFKSAGEALTKNLVEGIKKDKSKIVKEFTNNLDDAVSGIKGHYNDFHDAGSYLVEGFADGISQNTYKAEAKAKAMAEAAEKAAKKALDINSPSKVFRRIGYFVPEGFAQGIDRMGKVVRIASASMAESAFEETRAALGKLPKFFDPNVKTMPVIKPVVDLSGVSDGVSKMTDMFSVTPSVGVMANIGVISSMMNRRQNGANDDVISAINGLGQRISESSGDSYTINGISYDDNGNVADAIRTLVRAARIEGRT